MSLQELDLVALVEDADLSRPQLIGRVEEAHEPIPDLTSLEVLERPNAGSVERHVGRVRDGAEGVRPADLLQGGSSPARQECFVHCLETGRGFGFVDRGSEWRVGGRFVVIATPFAEEDECRPCRLRRRWRSRSSERVPEAAAEPLEVDSE